MVKINPKLGLGLLNYYKMRVPTTSGHQLIAEAKGGGPTGDRLEQRWGRGARVVIRELGMEYC
jgi:hypothetical protein